MRWQAAKVGVVAIQQRAALSSQHRGDRQSMFEYRRTAAAAHWNKSTRQFQRETKSASPWRAAWSVGRTPKLIAWTGSLTTVMSSWYHGLGAVSRVQSFNDILISNNNWNLQQSHAPTRYHYVATVFNKQYTVLSLGIRSVGARISAPSATVQQNILQHLFELSLLRAHYSDEPLLLSYKSKLIFGAYVPRKPEADIWITEQSEANVVPVETECNTCACWDGVMEWGGTCRVHHSRAESKDDDATRWFNIACIFAKLFLNKKSSLNC